MKWVHVVDDGHCIEAKIAVLFWDWQWEGKLEGNLHLVDSRALLILQGAFKAICVTLLVGPPWLLIVECESFRMCHFFIPLLPASHILWQYLLKSIEHGRHFKQQSPIGPVAPSPLFILSD